MLRCGVCFFSAAAPVPDLSVGEMSYTPESQASLSVSAASKADSWEGDMLVLLAFQQEDKKAFGVLAGAAAEAADKALDGAAVDLISTQEFKVRNLQEEKGVAGNTVGVCEASGMRPLMSRILLGRCTNMH